MEKPNRPVYASAADLEASSQDVCDVKSIDLTGNRDAHLGTAYHGENGPVYWVRGESQETDEA